MANPKPQNKFSQFLAQLSRLSEAGIRNYWGSLPPGDAALLLTVATANQRDRIVQALSFTQINTISRYWRNDQASLALLFSGLSARQVGMLSLDFSSVAAQCLNALAPSAVTGLTRNQLESLSYTTYQGLSANWVACLSLSQIGDLLHIDWLSPSAVTGLSAAQVGLIRIHFGYMNANWLNALKPKAIAGLTLTQLQQLSYSAYQGLSKNFVAALSVQQMEYLWHPDWLSPDAVSGLSAAQVDHIRIDFCYMSPQWLSALRAEVVMYMSPQHFRQMNATQIQALDTRGMIQQLAWLDVHFKTVLEALSADQIARLSLAAFSNLSAQLVSRLSTIQLSVMTLAQIQALNAGGLTSAQLAYQNLAWPAKTLLDNLLLTQIGQLSEASLRGLSPDILGRLKSAQREAMSKTQRQAVLEVMISTMSDAQIRALDSADLNIAHLRLTNAQGHIVSALLTPSQIGALDAETVSSLSVAQLNGFGVEQFRAVNPARLTLAQLSGLDQNRVVLLTRNQFAQMTDQQVQAINAAWMTHEQHEFTNLSGHPAWYLNPPTPLPSQEIEGATRAPTVSLFGVSGKPQAQDINQGMAYGDCYLLAVVSALAQTNSDWFKESTRLHSDGTISVRFFQDDGTVVWIRETAMYSPSSALFRVGTQSEFDSYWVAAIEKAWIRFIGGDSYSALMTSGLSPDFPTRALTGNNVDSYTYGKIDFDTLRLYFEQGNVISYTSWNAYGYALVSHHVYAVIGLNAESRTVHIANPWGSNAGFYYRDFWISFDTLVSNDPIFEYNYFTIGKSSGASGANGQLSRGLIIADLSIEQTSALTADQVAQFVPEQVYALTSAQLSALSVASLQAIHAAYLSADQLGYECASGHSVCSELLPAQLAKVPASTLSAIPAAAVAQLSQAQILALSRNQIQALDVSLWGATELNYLNPNGISIAECLSPIQIASLPADTVSELTAAIFSRFNTQQLAAMNSTQLQALTAAQIGFLSVDQLSIILSSGGRVFTQLLPAQVTALSIDQIQGIAAADFFRDRHLSGYVPQTWSIGPEGIQSVLLGTGDATQLTLEQIGITDHALFKSEVIGLEPYPGGVCLLRRVPEADSYRRTDILILNDGQGNIIAKAASSMSGICTLYIDIPGTTFSDTQLTAFSLEQRQALLEITLTQMTDAQIRDQNAAEFTLAHLSLNTADGHTVLSQLSAHQVASLADTTVSTLSEGQITSLTSTQAEGLRTQQISLLTDVQAQALNTVISTSNVLMNTILLNSANADQNTLWGLMSNSQLSAIVAATADDNIVHMAAANLLWLREQAPSLATTTLTIAQTISAYQGAYSLSPQYHDLSLAHEKPLVVNHSPTGSVLISGTLREGQVLVAQNTLADADGLGAISYQWQTSQNDGKSWDTISGAKDKTFMLTSEQVGKQIRVQASYTDGRGTAEQVASLASGGTVANLVQAMASFAVPASAEFSPSFANPLDSKKPVLLLAINP
jgi:hypothetical protein